MLRGDSVRRNLAVRALALDSWRARQSSTAVGKPQEIKCTSHIVTVESRETMLQGQRGRGMGPGTQSLALG